ncbi:hypothetical protein BHM03_00049218 [Ensete ventricosum]|nr:hypothetical protein BHM03_00049218 [Ensete ventricosum]
MSLYDTSYALICHMFLAILRGLVRVVHSSKVTLRWLLCSALKGVLTLLPHGCMPKAIDNNIAWTQHYVHELNDFSPGGDIDDHNSDIAKNDGYASLEHHILELDDFTLGGDISDHSGNIAESNGYASPEHHIFKLDDFAPKGDVGNLGSTFNSIMGEVGEGDIYLVLG